MSNIEPNVLVAILCIDERYQELKRCYKNLLKDNSTKHILGIFREKDIKCQLLVTHCLIVDNYESYDNEYNSDRHNIKFLALKRTMALKYARDNNYDKLIFIDSDIMIDPNLTLFLLLQASKHCDIVLIPYGIRRFDMIPVLGYIKDGHISIEKVRDTDDNIFHQCHVGGMGCTLINVKSPKIPQTFNVKTIMDVSGEDIDFFLDAFRNGCIVLASSRYTVKHTI